jgi:hypothetical protein
MPARTQILILKTKKGSMCFPFRYGAIDAAPKKFGAGKESRTLDLNLGKVALYQLSYSRVEDRIVPELFSVLQHLLFLLH